MALDRTRQTRAAGADRTAYVSAVLVGVLLLRATIATAQPTATAQYASVAAAETAALDLFAHGDTVPARRIFAVTTAYRWIQVPYRWGGIGKTAAGIDCSALVRAAFTRAGVGGIPRTSHEQARIGVAVARDLSALKPADLLVFGRAGHVSHVGLYLSGGWFVHSASSTHGVTVSRLSDAMWQRLWIGARRVIRDPPTTRDTVSAQ